MVDGMVSHFVEESTNFRSLAAMATGSLFYRLGRIGTLAFAARAPQVAPLLNIASYGIGLGSEVTAFEGTNRLLATLSGDTSNPNLWRWGGQGGWGRGLASSFINFGLLKGSGHLLRQENVVLQHLFSDLSMVGGNNLVGALGLLPRPEGTFAEQMLHAEITNLQLGLGMGLLHTLAPGMAAFERSLDLSIQSAQFRPLSSPRPSLGERQWAEAFASGEGGFLSETREAEREKTRHLVLMANDEKVNGRAKSDPPRSGNGSASEGTGKPLTPIFHSRFQLGWESLTPQGQEATRRAIRLLFEYYQDGVRRRGLGFKKLGGGQEDFYEIRTSQKNRVLFRRNNGDVEFLFVGGHDELDMIVRSSALSKDQGRASADFDPLRVEAGEETATEIQEAPTSGESEEIPSDPPSSGERAEVSEAAAMLPEDVIPPVLDPAFALEGLGERSEKVPPPSTGLDPVETVLETPFPEVLKTRLPELALIARDDFRSFLQNEKDAVKTILAPEGRALLQLLCLVRRLHDHISPDSRADLQAFEEETLTRPGSVEAIAHLSLLQYEREREAWLHLLPLHVVRAFWSAEEAIPPFEGIPAGYETQRQLSLHRLNPEMENQWLALYEPTQPGSLETYLEGVASFFIRNHEAIGRAPTFSPREETAMEKEFPELNLVGREHGGKPSIGEILAIRGEIPLLSQAHFSQVDAFWSQALSRNLLQARRMAELYLRDFPASAPIFRLFTHLSLASGTGADLVALAETGNRLFESSYRTLRKDILRHLIRKGEGGRLVSILPEVQSVALQEPIDIDLREFSSLRSPAHETTQRVVSILLADTKHAASLDKFWESLPGEEAAPQSLRGLLSGLHTKLCGLYAERRDNVRVNEGRIEKTLATQQDSLDQRLAQFPWAYPELALVTDEKAAEKRRRVELSLDMEGANLAIFRFSEKLGFNGEVLTERERAEEMGRDLRAGRLKIPAGDTQVLLDPQAQMEIVPFSDFYRIRRALENALPETLFRMLHLIAENETPMKPLVAQELNRATLLALLGAPAPWLYRQLAERVEQHYRAHRATFLDQFERRFPEIYVKTLHLLPDAELIDPNGVLDLVQKPAQKTWPAPFKAAVNDFVQRTQEDSRRIPNRAEFSVITMKRLIAFYIHNRQEILNQLGVTEELRDVLLNYERDFGEDRMPELYQIPSHVLAGMSLFFTAAIDVIPPGSPLVDLSTRANIASTWPHLPPGWKQTFLQFLGPDRSKFPHRSLLRTLAYYRENRHRILPYLSFNN